MPQRQRHDPSKNLVGFIIGDVHYAVSIHRVREIANPLTLVALPKAPILFTKPRTALADPYPAAIPVPKAAQDGTSDYEAELCVVIGKTGRDIPEDKALDYVLGYTCSNDVSARTMQMFTTQWSFSKGLDGSCPLGMHAAIRS